MSNITTILNQAVADGVYLYLQEGKLKFRAKKGGLSDTLKSQIQQHKAAIIDYLDQLQTRQSFIREKLPDIDKAPQDIEVPLSYAQQRLWFIHELEQGSASYNIPAAFKLTGVLHRAAFEKAIYTIIERHEVLRTGFVNVDGEVRQQVRERFELPLVAVDLSSVDATEQQHKVQALAESDAGKSFDLVNELMLRVKLVKLAEQQHVVLFNMHHIASDGWSMGVLVREFSALYGAYLEQQPNPLKPLKIQYGDYANWQRNWLDEKRLAQHLDYWQQQLAELPQVHSLPLDKPRPAEQSFRGAAYGQQLDGELTEGLKTLCQTQDVTLFMLMHSAFALLLSRYSGQSDIVVGTPIAGRDHHDVEPLIGFFVNTLVLRSDLSHNLPFVDYLANSRQMVLDAYNHQQIPFEMLVEKLAPQRSLSHSPVVQVSLNLQKTEQHRLRMPGLELEKVVHDEEHTPFEINVHITERGDGLALSWHYNTDLFVADTIASWAAHYELLLQRIVANCQTPIQDLDLLSEQEREQQLHQWQPAPTPYPADVGFHQMIAAQAAKTPGHIALDDGEKQLSYAELDSRSNQLARFLIDQGVEPQQPVALLCPRNVEMMIGLLAIAKAGGAYVPLDPISPEARIEQVLEDAAIEVVLTTQDVLEQLSLSEQTLVLLDESFLDAVLSGYDITPVVRDGYEFSAEHLAYVIYTSGSTGRPKGVMVRHRGLSNYLDYAVNHYCPGLDGSVVSSSLAFDATITSLLAPLCCGLQVNLLADDHQLLEHLAERLSDPEQSLLFKLTPAHLEGLKKQPGLAVNHCSQHVLVLGGEQLTRHCVTPFVSQWLTNSRFINEYGPTETVVGCAVHQVSQQDIASGQEKIAIGRALNNTRLFVLDDNRRLLPCGVVGELYIGGAGLARGYLGRSDLTGEKFIEQQWADGRVERLYQSGDLVRLLPDGQLQFEGRRDEQLKLRGFRIEPGEVESHLANRLEVDRCAVMLRGEGDDCRLVAYIVPSIALEAEDEALLIQQKHRLIEQFSDTLKTQVPHYMVPSVFVFVPLLPLTDNGKVDRNALPEPSEDDLQKQCYVAPSNEVEQVLCDIWQDVLGLKQVGIDDDFFALGGHSLLGTRLISQVREKLAIEVPIRVLFEYPTVAGFAHMLPSFEKDLVMTGLTRADREQPLVLSYAQQRLWFVEQINGQSAQYNMPGAFKLEGKLDVSALAQALHSIIARHEVLRTRFSSVAGEAHQVIVETFKVPLEHIDLSALSADEQQQQVRQMAEQDARKAFNLSKDLLLRLTLLKLAEEVHVVLFCMHHIASDGWSVTLMIREFTTLYDAYSRSEPNPLPPLNFQYADYAAWQRQWLQGEVLQQQLGYWTEQLAGIPQLHSLPLDKPRPVQQAHIGASYGQQVDGDLVNQLQLLCQTMDVTLFMLLHSALSVLVGRYGNQQDVVIGTAIAGRVHQDVEPMIGFFINDLVLRCDLSDNPTFAALLGRNKQMILDAYAHQHVPFEMLVEALSPERNLRHNPIVQIKLDLQNNEQAQLSLPGIELSMVEQSNSISRYDLYLSVTETDSGLALNWRYNSELFLSETIARMSANLVTLLGDIARDHSTPVSRLALVSEQEQLLLQQNFNASQRDYPTGLCLHQLFEQQAALHPEHPAIICGGESISYGELNREANRVAHYLIEQGVQPDTLVGLCVERSIEMYIGLFAIMKAGGAYVPLDPSYPQARLDHMLEDSGVEIVLSESQLFSNLELDDKQVVLLDEPMREVMMASYSDLNVDAAAIGLTPQNLVYVIYTSGSTGKPKGVLVEHHTVVNFMFYSAETFMPEHLKGALVSAPLAFDGTVCTLYSPLLQGKYVELLTASDTAIDLLADYLFDDAKPLLFKLTPAHLEALLAQAPDKCNAQAEHVFVVAGELLSEKTLAVWRDKKLPKSIFYNEYGPTECTVGTTVYRTYANQPIHSVSGSVPIGSPLANARLYVLDEQRQLLPLGCAGELYIGGLQLARGYHNRQAMTAERFVEDHFNGNDSGCGRLYRTGDLVRWLPDGNIEFLGRIDNQVKLRGFRIELSEIENQLNKLEDIKEAVVVLRDDKGFDKRLVAYVVPSQPLEGEDEELLAEQKLARVSRYIDRIKGHLPQYMVPGIFVFMEQFPLTPNGKVDRANMPLPGEGDLQKQAYVAPRNEVEAQLCEIWQAVLGVEQISIHDDFFVLGGHSLLATRMMAMMRERMAIEVAVAALFEHHTIAGLAEALPSFTRNKVEPSIVPRRQQDNLPLSFAQQRMWLIDQLGGGSVQYNMPGAIELKGQINLDAIKQAFTALIERHEILRTRFERQGGEVYQRIAEHFTTPVNEIDLTALEPALQQVEASAMAKADAIAPFDLSRDLPMRVQLLKLADDHVVMLYNLHHIASDGWSNAIWTREFVQCYQALVQQSQPDWAPLPVQYADYALWQRDYLQGEVLQSQLDYWSAALADAPVMHSLPLDFERPEQARFQGAMVQSTLPGNEAEALLSLCGQAGVTPFMLVHAAFSLLLARHSNVNDVVIGTPVAGRSHQALADLIGCFVNSLALRTDLTGIETFSDYLEYVKQVDIGAQGHQDIPFEQLVEHLRVPRSTQHEPVFQIMLSMDTNTDSELSLEGIELKSLSGDALSGIGFAAKFDITLDVKLDADGASFNWIYDKALFAEPTIARLSRHLVRLLRNIAAAPDCRLSQLQMLEPEELERYLSCYDHLTAGYPSDQSIDRLLEARAAQTPDAIALSDKDGNLSYAELNRRANRLARYLKASYPITADSLVGLCVERSMEMVIAMLAILKAGGAYVPLDPNYPRERIDHMLDDTAVGLILSQTQVQSQLAHFNGEVVLLDGLAAEMPSYCRDYGDGNLAADGQVNVPSQLAYVIYTSGSTGKPKGVMVEHRSVVRLLIGAEFMTLDEQTVMLHGSNISFDVATLELWGPLLNGGRCVLYPNVPLLPQPLNSLIEQQQVNSLWLTSGFFTEWTHDLQPLPSLKQVLAGGDVVNPAAIRHFQQQFAEVPLINGYGPTENTVFTSCYRFAPNFHAKHAPIGKPVATDQVYVLDDNLQLVGEGVCGELCVGGDGLARGYLNQPQLTAERFIDNPFYDPSKPYSAKKLYRTGDWVRHLPDGNLDFIGRMDEQVKVRGYRIEPGEIEVLLDKQDNVDSSFVMVKTSQYGKQLVAYVKPVNELDSAQQTVFCHSLKTELSHHLPDYMVPGAIVLLEHWPLTSNGKVDKTALPEPDATLLQGEYVAPSSDCERALLQIWSDLLQLAPQRLSVTADFFKLGGHSLLIVRMLAAIEQQFKLNLPLNQVYEEPNIAALASVIELMQAQKTQAQDASDDDLVQEMEW